MAYITADRVKETTTVTGTGPATLLGAVSGYRTFASSFSIGDTCAYAIVNANASEWEIGIATYSAANTLTRTTVQSSTNANAVVNFSAGTKDVFLGITAGSIPGFNPITNTITSGTWNGNTIDVARGGTGVTTATGSGSVVLSTTPTLVTPQTNAINAVPVGSGAGNSLTLTAGSGVGTGAGGSLVLQAGIQATSGGDGKVIVKQAAGQTSNPFEYQDSTSTTKLAVQTDGTLLVKNGSATSSDLSIKLVDVANTGITIQGDRFNFYTSGTVPCQIVANRIGINVPILPGSNILEIRNATAGQKLQLYNTWTDGNNYERLGINWASNTCTIGLEKAGTGLPRTLNVNANALNAPALPVAATVTAATGNGTTVTYTCASNFAIGQVVSITGLTITTGSSLNLSNQTITGVTTTAFTVTNATVGTAAATQAGTATIQSAGNSLTITAGNGSGVGAGGNIILQPGAQGTSGGNGIVQCTKKLEFYTGSSKTDLAFQINNSTTGMWYNSGANMFVWTINNTDTICFRQGYIRLSKGGGIYWSNTTNDAITLNDDTSIYSASRGVFAVDAPMQSVNPQGGSLAYRSFTTNQAASVNDWVMGPSAFQRVNCTTASSITGIAPYTSGVHVDGRMIRIYNVGAYNLTLSHNSTSSAAANRFFNSTGADIILATHQYVELIYDSTDNGRGGAGWRVSSIH